MALARHPNPLDVFYGLPPPRPPLAVAFHSLSVTDAMAAVGGGELPLISLLSQAAFLQKPQGGK